MQMYKNIIDNIKELLYKQLFNINAGILFIVFGKYLFSHFQFNSSLAGRYFQRNADQKGFFCLQCKTCKPSNFTFFTAACLGSTGFTGNGKPGIFTLWAVPVGFSTVSTSMGSSVSICCCGTAPSFHSLVPWILLFHLMVNGFPL